MAALLLPAIKTLSCSRWVSSSLTFARSSLLLRCPFGFSFVCPSFGAPRGMHLLPPASSPVASSSSMDRQFEEFRSQLEESGAVREKLRFIVSDLETVTRVMQSQLLLIHHSLPSPETLNKVKSHIDRLRSMYSQLAEVIKDCPGQYYRYHDHWRNQTYTVVFLLVFIHWLETGGLLSHSETVSLLELNQDEFGLDLEDYLIGLCNLSSELPRYVVNQVTVGDYGCAKRAAVFLSDLYAAFRILNLRNDTLRKRFDGMKYDLKKVEEVLYDVKIRGLLAQPSTDKVAQDI